jgi:hypothetical protein
MTHCDETAYVATLIMLYVDLPHTPLRPGPQDQSTARRLYCQGVPLSVTIPGKAGGFRFWAAQTRLLRGR